MSLSRSLVVPAVAAALALTACSGTDASSAAPAQEAQTRTVEHVRGTTEVPVAPQRVVVLDLGGLDSAVALGVKPVGAVSAPVQDGLLSYLEQQSEGIELVGEIGAPDLEQVAALEPDLILGSEVRVGELYDELSAIAPTVLTESVGVDWKADLQLHAQALGREDQAAALLDAHQARAEEVDAAVDDETTVSVVRFVPGEIRLSAKESFIGTVLDDAGIARPAAQDVEELAVTASPEQIGLADADVVFVGTYGDPAETDGPAVLAGPLWQRLSAVAAGEVHEVDDDVWFLGAGAGAADLVLDDLERVLGG